MKKVIAGLLLVVILAGVLFLALQGPKETTELSENVRKWFLKLGYRGTASQFRSDFHLIEYFVVGLALMFFACAAHIRLWKALIAGCFIGLLEETLKIFLPTREFSATDWLKDCTGIAAAFLLVVLIRAVYHRIKHVKSPSD